MIDEMSDEYSRQVHPHENRDPRCSCCIGLSRDEMLNQREEKTGAGLSSYGACDIKKWSDFFPVCGKIVVKRKITAKSAVIFLKNGGPNRDRTDDLTDANRTLSQLSYRPKSTVPKAEQKNKAI